MKQLFLRHIVTNRPFSEAGKILNSSSQVLSMFGNLFSLIILVQFRHHAFFSSVRTWGVLCTKASFSKLLVDVFSAPHALGNRLVLSKDECLFRLRSPCYLACMALGAIGLLYLVFANDWLQSSFFWSVLTHLGWSFLVSFFCLQISSCHLFFNNEEYPIV